MSSVPAAAATGPRSPIGSAPTEQAFASDPDPEPKTSKLKRPRAMTAVLPEMVDQAAPPDSSKTAVLTESQRPQFLIDDPETVDKNDNNVGPLTMQSEMPPLLPEELDPTVSMSAAMNMSVITEGNLLKKSPPVPAVVIGAVVGLAGLAMMAAFLAGGEETGPDQQTVAAPLETEEAPDPANETVEGEPKTTAADRLPKNEDDDEDKTQTRTTQPTPHAQKTTRPKAEPVAQPPRPQPKVTPPRQPPPRKPQPRKTAGQAAAEKGRQLVRPPLLSWYAPFWCVRSGLSLLHLCVCCSRHRRTAKTKRKLRASSKRRWASWSAARIARRAMCWDAPSSSAQGVGIQFQLASCF